MLNNLTNFFSIIKSKAIKTSLQDSDLIAIGTKQSPALGDYKPTAIQFADLKAQIQAGMGGLTFVTVDGITITGSGVPGDPLVGQGVDVRYSNILWVDRANGNDTTAEIGVFNKPFQNISAAVSAAYGQFSSTDRGLIYIRKAEYTDPVYLYPDVDFYAEPGVTFTRNGFIDTPSTGTVNIYGYARFLNSSAALVAMYSSNIYMEFDEANQGNTSIYNSNGVLEIKPTSAYNCNITVKCRKIKSYCTNAYAVTVRGNSNVNLIVDESIEGTYDPIYLRYSADGTNFSGTLNVTCPNITTLDGGWAGNLATYKSGIKLFRVASTAKITINGNFFNKCAAYYGTGVCTVNASAGTQETLTINGNVNSPFAGGFNVSGTGSKFTFRGTMNIGGYGAVTNGTAEVKFIDSAIVLNSNVSYATIGNLAGSSIIYFVNTSIVNPNAGNVTNANPTSYVYHYNTQAYSSNIATPGLFANGGNIGAVNSFCNTATAGTTNVFTTLGLTTDTLFKLPTF